ncbi:MAG TPA: PilZ domain-containing protein [Gemmatimonadales bacterium]|nr:PilZ domain-containing protein [Gemmatimonadales bacterium]
MTTAHRRAEPRLAFPDGPQPTLEAGGKVFPILDLSTRGIRFRASSTDLTIGEILRGVIRLSPDRAIAVEGRVLRTSGNQIAARLQGGFPVSAGTVGRRPASGLLW